MIKKVVLFFVLLVLLNACSADVINLDEQKDGQNTNNQSQTTNIQQDERPTNLTLTPIFKIIKQQAIRSPPVVSGTIENNGMGDGTAKVTARIYYAGAIASEKSTLVPVVAGKNANFSISFDNMTQWTGYDVIIE